MQKPGQTLHVNKPFLLICLFTLATLAATWMNTGEAPASDAAPMARDAGHGALPVCGSDALTLSARCQPQPARQA